MAQVTPTYTQTPTPAADRPAPSKGRTVFAFTASIQFYPAIRKWNWLIKVPEALNGISGDGYDTGDAAWDALFAKLRELNPLSI